VDRLLAGDDNAKEALLDAAGVIDYQPKTYDRTPMANSYEKIELGSWSDFKALFDGNTYRSWAFRGQSDASWPLYSSLTRYLENFHVHQDNWVGQERRILRIFRRKAHLLGTQLPDNDDSFEWLALMQHHGAPTRLLDFTWSPHVAAFFALERATGSAAVWAICPPKLSTERFRTIRPSQETDAEEIGPWIRGNYERYFLPNQNKTVIIGEPHRMNQRLVAQSGTFVMPGVLNISVERIVADQCSHGAIVKIVLLQSLRRDAMKELYSMNITNATLFPGMDGLARSLGFELEFHWAFDPVTNEVYPGYRKD